jgi:hypothetical protein
MLIIKIIVMMILIIKIDTYRFGSSISLKKNLFALYASKSSPSSPSISLTNKIIAKHNNKASSDFLIKVRSSLDVSIVETIAYLSQWIERSIPELQPDNNCTKLEFEVRDWKRSM